MRRTIGIFWGILLIGGGALLLLQNLGYLGNLSVNHTSEAFWQDVLDARFAGPTKPYTLVNTGFGVKWAGDRVVTSLKVTNLANQEVMQHIFGDVLKRQVVGEARFTF